MDERARDEEWTGSGNSCGAEPAVRAPEPSLSAEANGPRAKEIARAPRADGPRHPLLPRAASGGAGAVAALAAEARWAAPELLPGRLGQPVGPRREPDGLLAVDLAPQRSTNASPAPTAADVAANGPAPGVDPTAADGAASPGPAQAFAGATDQAPAASFEPAQSAHATGASDGSPASPDPAQSPTPKQVWPTPADDETSTDQAPDQAPGRARDNGLLPQARPAVEDQSALRTGLCTGVAGLIPQVQPTPQILPPSMTLALGSVDIEPARIGKPDAARPSEAVAAPPVAMPAALLPASPPLQPTPAQPQLLGAAPAMASARVIPVPSPTPARELPVPSRDGFGVERRHVRFFLSAGLALLIGVGGLLMVLLLLYRWVDPPASTLMLSQRFAGTPTTQRWIPIERMSPNLVAAVIASEDGHFCRHHGVDWGELREAIESAGDGLARGGSTISMQVVKNLFLWPSRSYVRKAIEIPLAYSIEALWSKRRILEIYLNIAEWGPGIFGAEAAARYHFRKPALLLTAHEAALLAVSLPNPFDRQAGRPGPGTLRLADHLLLRMRAAQANTACVRGASQSRS